MTSSQSTSNLRLPGSYLVRSYLIATVLGSDSGGTFCLLFWNLHKEIVKQSMVIFSIDIGQRCTLPWHPMFLEH